MGVVWRLSRELPQMLSVVHSSEHDRPSKRLSTVYMLQADGRPDGEQLVCAASPKALDLAFH